MNRTYKTEGVILKRLNFGEADKIITIFSRHYGKIRCIAKGIRNITSRKGGNLELFNRVVVFIAKGKNMDIITEVQLLDSYSVFRRDLKKVALVFQAAELIDRLTADNQTNDQILVDFYEFLEQLSKGQKEDQETIKDFKIKLLQATGFGLPNVLMDKEIDDHIEKIIEKRVKCFYE